VEFNDTRQKEEFVHRTFTAIAHRYDLLNTVLSFNQDKYWRRFTARKAGLKEGGTALDVACGTGMLSFELARIVGPTGKVVGVDFCESMLQKAGENLLKTPYSGIVEFKWANAMELPFADNAFDCATMGVASRNMPDLRRVFKEMARVVRPGGKVVNLDFSRPTMFGMKQAYNFYLHHLIPLIGKLGVGQDGPYSWLAKSQVDFLNQEEFKALLEEIGLVDVTYYNLTGGVVAVHVGTKVADR